jgi:2-keto-4-pentenoate hydratase/2-oxohepta-3-ene-1,7-dioic acid hydratase in catechol pathway
MAAVVVALLCAPSAPAQSGERFGIGMFKHQGRTFAGLVMRFPVEPQQKGGVVVEIPAAARAAGQAGIPDNVGTIIEQWEKVGPQLKKIVAHVGPLIDRSRPAYVHDYKAMDVLAPFVPRLALYGFGNYRPDPDRPAPSPSPGASPRPSPTPAPSILGLWERDPGDTRPVNPRVFMIPNTPEVFIGDGEPVVIWHADKGRDQYEYECELAAVVGKKMRRVPVGEVKNYIMGYTITNDISDRQGRGPVNDWPAASNDPLLRKGKDSSKPIGPFIVPAEFVDPLKLKLKMTVGGVLVQDDDTSLAWHNVYEYGTYLSNLITVPVGSVIAMGTPPGSHGGLGRFMKDGDVQICSYEGLGTLTNPVKGEGISR